ncbi:MAG: hypothetical protein MJZ61_09645 [Bacteroidales bacterium]|nr:hypothetical protein [Bacteroidales bacterium]
MKKSNNLWLIGLVMLVMMSLTFVSCGDDDDNSPSYTADQFYGSWKCTKLEGSEDELINSLNGATFKFNKDFVDDCNGAVTIAMAAMGNFDMGFVWALNGNVVSLNILTYKVDFEIMSYTENEVQLSAEVSGSKVSAAIIRVK